MKLGRCGTSVLEVSTVCTIVVHRTFHGTRFRRYHATIIVVASTIAPKMNLLLLLKNEDIINPVMCPSGKIPRETVRSTIMVNPKSSQTAPLFSYNFNDNDTIQICMRVWDQ